jgi:hypothetical protein
VGSDGEIDNGDEIGRQDGPCYHCGTNGRECKTPNEWNCWGGAYYCNEKCMLAASPQV